MHPLDQTLVRCLGHESLHLILIPSEACDPRCGSCPQDPATSRMRPEVIRGVKNLLTDRADELDSLTLSWSGGEPLLAQDVMEEVLQHACALNLAFPGLSFQSDVTTNAHLLDGRTFGRLRALGLVRFQVPIELAPPESTGGPAPAEPASSPWEGRTWSNLRALRGVRGDFVVEVRALVQSPRQVSELVEAFRRTFSDDPRFRLIVRRPLATSADRSSLVAPPRATDATHARGATGAIASQVFPDAYVVRANGRIDTCTWPRRSHPSGRELGHLAEEGRLHLDR